VQIPPEVPIMKYNQAADDYLMALYGSVGATTWEHKFNTLMLKMMVVPEHQAFSHYPTIEQKVGMLEYELLEREGLIELVSV
jgi:hypothetical protein